MDRKKASDFPQELLNLFDLYVHGEIPRREFLAGAQKVAVGGVTATALLEMLRPNYAWAIQVPENDSRIKAETATVQSPKGNRTISGYFVRPANVAGKLPVVLVIHENRGLNPYTKDVARRLAIANFIAFAPDALLVLRSRRIAGDVLGDEGVQAFDLAEQACRNRRAAGMKLVGDGAAENRGFAVA